MKRNELVDSLIKEGLSEKTLSKLTDNQINILATRMLSEEIQQTSVTANVNDPNFKQVMDKLKQSGVQNVNVTEDLKGNQKKIDKNHNGKIDSQDFKILNGQKKMKVCDDCGKELHKCSCDYRHMDESKPSAGLSNTKKSEVVKKAKSGGDIGKKGKGFEKIVDKATKKYGSKEVGKKVAAAAMWKNVQRESVEKNKWVNNLVEREYFHNFTSKGEIMEMIKSKLNENPEVAKTSTLKKVPAFFSAAAIKASGPTTKPAPTKPGTKPGTNPGKPKSPSRPDTKPKTRPKMVGMEEGAPTTKPAPTKPGTKPGTNPGKPKSPSRPDTKPKTRPKMVGMEEDKKGKVPVVQPK